MREKIIGYFTSKLHEDDSFRDFEIFHEYAYKNNYGVITYYVDLEWNDKDEQDTFDSYYMINFNKLDAIVIDFHKISDHGFIKLLYEKALSLNIPVYVFNDMIEEVTSVTTKVENSFEQLLDHVITKHGAKNINLVLGIPHKWNSDYLIEIYKNALSNHDISYEDGRIEYGYYWTAGARTAFDKLLKKGKPDAIICANDVMAIEIIDYAAELGYSVPKDFIVTGIDGSKRSDFFQPLLTTIKKDPNVVIAKIFELMKQDFSKGFKPRVIHIDCPIRYGQSCGCKTESGINYSKQIDYMYNQRNESFWCDGMLTHMSQQIYQSSTMSEISKALSDNIPVDSFVCVKKDFLQDIFDVSDNQRIISDEKMYIIADRRERTNTWASYNRKDLCPDFDNIIKQDYPLVIVPVKYQSSDFGYLVVHSEKYQLRLFIAERFVSGMSTLFGRYINERRLSDTSFQLNSMNESFNRLKNRDIMTGMLNTFGLVSELNEIREKCSEGNEKLVLICVDIERLGNINDVYGHSEGDIAIQTVAALIKDCMGEGDICAHLGSDEFIICIRGKEDADKVFDSFETSFITRVDNYNEVSGKEYSLEVYQSYIAFTPEKDMDAKKLIDKLVSMKQLEKLNKRRNADNIHATDAEEEAEHLLVKDILDHNKFKYAYQPIINAKTGDVFAYEALMRTDTEQFVSPLTVIKHATATDRLYEIEKATFFNVLGQVFESKEALGERKIFLNSIPGYQLDNNDYARVKNKYSSMFDNLVVEITEQTEMNDDGFGLIRTRSDREGFQVAIDDFGTGYSNTATLLKYLPNYVKIDRMLITNVHEDPKKQHFVRNIIEFAHSNGFMALAEGVETIEELRAVIHMDVDLIQGFYTAKPEFGFMQSLPEKIRHEILDANVSGYTTIKKKMYLTSREQELLLMRIALEQYTGIIVSQPELTIVGNPDYSAGVVIKIRDDCTCRLKIKNVKLASEDDSPCIELGKNSHLTLVCEDNNELLQSGILVPEGSSLTLEGAGNLNISVSGSECFAIGNKWSSTAGDITLAMDGALTISTDGNKCIGVGAGIAGLGTIHVLKGKINARLEGVEGIGIGWAEGGGSVLLSECNAELLLHVARGTAIGAMNGTTDVKVINARIVLEGSGNSLCGIGSLENGAAKLNFESCRLIMTLSGRSIYLLGCKGGAYIDILKARLDLTGEGSDCLGIGTENGDASLRGILSTFNITIRAGKATFLGVREDVKELSDVVENYTEK